MIRYTPAIKRNFRSGFTEQTKSRPLVFSTDQAPLTGLMVGHFPPDLNRYMLAFFNLMHKICEEVVIGTSPGRRYGRGNRSRRFHRKLGGEVVA